ncbi:hypothetical protein ZWY2020_042645 [Hordeum vulgare]|nr:hypothetical protein ZWY2020_042645 [Hordeum vulgare]
MNRFEDILAKKEEACVRRSEITEEKKAEMFTLLMDAADKKLTLEERRTMIEERKTVLVEKRRQKDEVAVADYEDATEADVEFADAVEIDIVDSEGTGLGRHGVGQLNADRRRGIEQRWRRRAWKELKLGDSQGIPTSSSLLQPPGPPSPDRAREAHPPPRSISGEALPIESLPSPCSAFRRPVGSRSNGPKTEKIGNMGRQRVCSVHDIWKKVHKLAKCLNLRSSCV